MWILLVIWIIFFVDGVCHLLLALLPLRHALQHYIKPACHVLIYTRLHGLQNMVWRNFRKACAGFLECVCLLCECVSQLLTLASCVCVAVAHGLQGALFLCASTARCAQHLLLLNEDEWLKELKQQRERLQKQRRQMGELPMRW